MAIKLTRAEMETIIIYNLQDDTASCETADRAMMNRLDKLCAKSSDITRTECNGTFARYVFPRKWVSVKMPRVLTDEKRAEMAQRARERFHGGADGEETEGDEE